MAEAIGFRFAVELLFIQSPELPGYAAATNGAHFFAVGSMNGVSKPGVELVYRDINLRVVEGNLVLEADDGRLERHYVRLQLGDGCLHGCHRR